MKKWIRLAIFAGLFLLFLMIYRRPTKYPKPVVKEELKTPALTPETPFDLTPKFVEKPKYPTDHYFNSIDFSDLDKRLVQLHGFQFCKILNGAYFDTLVPISDLKGSLAQVNPDIHDFINLIDGRGYDIYQAILRKFHLANQKEVRRVACYTAAEGQTLVANMTLSRLVSHIDPVAYFGEVIPAITLSRSVLPGHRKKYKLAYLLMVHDKNGYAQLEKLLDLLDDGDAIILIHVDARPASSALYNLLSDYIRKKRIENPNCAVHLAKHRFSNIWGHISLVFTQLSGFWELLDMAEWDYVINLSNYDYPLKRNAQIYESLKSYGDMNFIEYWPDTAERFYRIHLGLADFSSLYHPSELGIVTWPFTNWRAYKHHQWVVLTPETIQFLRTDRDSLMFLAFAEHTYIPDESYFGTVLVNSPKMSAKIINNNKRYLRFVGGAHPSWLGYKDRYLFPPYETNPSFYFIRKFNTQGNVFQEPKLISWIEKHHYKNDWDGVCSLELASVRPECLKKYVDGIKQENAVIVVPVNSKILRDNLKCALDRLKITNVIWWALDLDVFEILAAKDEIAIMVPGLNPMPDKEKRKSKTLIKVKNTKKVMRKKPIVIEMLLNTGVDVWYLDADTVPLHDFRLVKEKSVDVYISLEQTKPMITSGSMLFFRNTKNSKAILEMYKNELSKSSLLDDEDAIRRIIKRPKQVRVLDPNHDLMYGKGDDSESTTPTIRFLDPYAFISPTVFEKPDFIPAGTKHYIVHTHNHSNLKGMLSSFGIWFIEYGKCTTKPIHVNFRQ